MTEDQLQSQFFIWAHNTYPQIRGLLFAVPNGGFRNKIEAMKLKATGTVAGIPDILLLWDHTVHAFEFKTEEGIISPEQKKIHEIWRLNGFNVYLVRDFESAKRILCQIINQ